MRDINPGHTQRLRRPPIAVVPIAMILAAASFSCRTPDLPVIKDKSRGIIYDTAMEAELRSGHAPALLQTSYGDYVDTLAEPVAITGWSDKSCDWEIFVGTNRGQWDDADAAPDPNRVLDHAQFGRAAVTIPRGPRDQSSVPASLLWRKKRAEDQISAEVQSTRVASDEFLEGVCGQLERSRQGDLLLFVHGFNVSFEAALIGTAQLALNMPFNGAVVTYAWPTQGGVFRYSDD